MTRTIRFFVFLLALLPWFSSANLPALAVTEKTIQDPPPASAAPEEGARRPVVRKKIQAPRHVELSFATLRENILVSFIGKVPRQWGENVAGTKTRLHADQKIIALTFDACGGTRGSGYDAKLINFLKREKIPATLFLSGRWIDANPQISKELAANPLFEIGNHGLNHRPCSVNGKKAQGIQGTKNIDELIDEIDDAHICFRAMFSMQSPRVLLQGSFPGNGHRQNQRIQRWVVEPFPHQLAGSEKHAGGVVRQTVQLGRDRISLLPG